MGRGAILLDKLYEREGNMHYYKVSSPHYENAEMFVRVNGNQKEVEFFLTDSFENPVQKISFTAIDEPLGTIEGKEHYAYVAALLLCKRMIDDNNFPQRASRCS